MADDILSLTSGHDCCAGRGEMAVLIKSMAQITAMVAHALPDRD